MLLRPGSGMTPVNSAISAPAKKVRPSQAMTIAVTSSDAIARPSASYSPDRTAKPSALTGGESETISAIPS
jgi:hypothetical protein